MLASKLLNHCGIHLKKGKINEMKEDRDFYRQKFFGKNFVIKIGGEVIKHAQKLESLLRDIKVLFDSGVNIVLVHGGGDQADEFLEKIGLKPKKIEGRRVTTKDDIYALKMLFGGTLNLEILGIMKKIGLLGIRVSGIDGGLAEAKKRDKKEGDEDFGFAGDIIRMNPNILNKILKEKIIPVVPPLTSDKDGQILNTNADTMAAEVAIALKAEKLIYFTSTNGVLDENKKPISVMEINESDLLISKGIVKGGMEVKLEMAKKALRNEVPRVHVLDGTTDQSILLEVFDPKGIGTLILENKVQKQKYLEEECKK